MDSSVSQIVFIFLLGILRLRIFAAFEQTQALALFEDDPSIPRLDAIFAPAIDDDELLGCQLRDDVDRIDDAPLLALRIWRVEDRKREVFVRNDDHSAFDFARCLGDTSRR